MNERELVFLRPSVPLLNMRCRFLLPALGLLSTGSCAYARSENAVSFLSPRKLEQGSPHNILVEYFGSIDGELTVVYGSCDTVPTPFDANYHIGTTHVGNHPLAKRHGDWIDCRPTSLVWITPSDVSEGCFHAFVNNAHVGRSGKVQVTKRLARRGRKTFADVADPMGPWFDGVAYLKQKQPDDRFVASSKNKTFGILGGGISGLTAGVYWSTRVDSTALTRSFS